MSQIRLCTRPQVIYMNLLEALSREKSLSMLKAQHESRERKELSAEAGYYTFLMEDQSTLIYVIIDQSTSIPYLLLSGPAADDAARLLYNTGMVGSIDEVIEWCTKADNTGDKIDAICRLGIASYFEMQPDILDIFTRYMQDTDVRVRQSAVFATSFVGWPEFEGMLKRTAEKDPDERVSMIAKSAIRIMRESDWKAEKTPG
ncbi:HEAT repeat domain-containing protein [Paenibacillus wulumuqiensis]|uniref:HEAT repeat domain-containing protein n=1 Tax=Paenibacillus wulumuqiensis TaxID=1567107 RepID=UPI000619CE36|nr:HEAT repeat domain-containing protein [Paenibacillus wulumuqiensis]